MASVGLRDSAADALGPGAPPIRPIHLDSTAHVRPRSNACPDDGRVPPRRAGEWSGRLRSARRSHRPMEGRHGPGSRGLHPGDHRQGIADHLATGSAPQGEAQGVCARQIQAPATARARRNEQRLPRRAHDAPQQGGDQGAAREAGRPDLLPGAVRARGAVVGPAQPSPHRQGVRPRHVGFHPLHRDGIHRRHRPARAGETGRPATDPRGR